MFRLKKELKQLKKEATPDKAFKRALWSELSHEFDHEYGRARIFGWKFAAVPALAMVLFVTMGTGVYAYSSPAVSEGHALHPIKDRLEQIEERFAVSPRAKVTFYAKMMNRRMDEAEFLTRIEEDRTDRLTRIVDELDLTVERLETLKTHPSVRASVLQNLDDGQRRFLRIFATEQRILNNRLPEGENPTIEALIEELQTATEEDSIMDGSSPEAAGEDISVSETATGAVEGAADVTSTTGAGIELQRETGMSPNEPNN